MLFTFLFVFCSSGWGIVFWNGFYTSAIIPSIHINFRAATEILGYDLFGGLLAVGFFNIHFSYSSFPKYFLAGVLGPLVGINRIKYHYCSLFPCWVNFVTPAVIIRDLHLHSDRQISGHVYIFIVIACS